MQWIEITRWMERAEILRIEGRTEMLKREGMLEVLTALTVEGEKAEMMT